MKLIKILIALLTGTPRSPEDIIEEMNAGANELRKRAEFEKQEKTKNDEEAVRVQAEADKKTKELADKNAVHEESIARSERVAARFDDLTA